MLEETNPVNDNNKTPASEWICPFGKYRGQTYKLIALHDPDYAKWLVTVLRSNAAKNYLQSLL